jgi:hypothetical protein
MTNDLLSDRGIQRIDRIGWALAAAGTIAMSAARGVPGGCGFLCGALISLLNLFWWKSLVGRLGAPEQSGVPLRASASILALRYLLIGAFVYAMVKYFEVNLAAILLGLFVSVAAVILEILYELIFGP